MRSSSAALTLALALSTGIAACAPTPSEGPPAWCEPTGTLELSCAGPHCVAALIIDYKRLEPRGYRIFSLSGSAITTGAAAEKIATAHVVTDRKAKAPVGVDCDEADDFYNCWLDYKNADTWFVVIHAATGSVLFSGLEIWSNPVRGKDVPIPAGWRGPAALGCIASIPAAADRALVTTGIPMGSAPASTSREALELAQKTNLGEAFTKGKKYNAMVVSHSPATGEFDPEAADWFVWFTLIP